MIKCYRVPAKNEVVWQVSKIYHVYGSLWVAFRFVWKRECIASCFCRYQYHGSGRSAQAYLGGYPKIYDDLSTATFSEKKKKLKKLKSCIELPFAHPCLGVYFQTSTHSRQLPQECLPADFLRLEAKKLTVSWPKNGVARDP